MEANRIACKVSEHTPCLQRTPHLILAIEKLIPEFKPLNLMGLVSTLPSVPSNQKK